MHAAAAFLYLRNFSSPIFSIAFGKVSSDGTTFLLQNFCQVLSFDREPFLSTSAKERPFIFAFEVNAERN